LLAFITDHLVLLTSNLPCTCTTEILVATAVDLLVDVIFVGAIEKANNYLFLKKVGVN
jgi:hypothetical protein